VLTQHYEIPFQPEIGSNIQKLLFEPLDSVTASLLDREIRQVIKNFEPRASVDVVKVLPDYDKNGFTVTLQFYIINRTEPISIQFLLERVR
jgi:phage baseplate assembly protein W